MRQNLIRNTRYVIRQPITWLLLAFLFLASLYAVTTPLFEASDELWHYPMVQHLSRGGPLPVQDPHNVGPWRQEASQPPLYYYLMGWATAWIDTSDMAQVRWLNPHVDNGIVTPDGNTNLAVHTSTENWPWRGTALAVRLVRLLSVLMSAGTVLFTYLLAREFFDDEPSRLAAAGLVAFVPMFAFISGAVNNDNLASLLSAIILYLLVRLITTKSQIPKSQNPNLPSERQDSNPQLSNLQSSSLQTSSLQSLFLIGLLLGLAALTKQSALGLYPLTGLTLVVASLPQSRINTQYAIRDTLIRITRSSLIVFIPALLIPAPWYYRNLVLYGDLLGWNGFIAVLGKRAQPASLLQLWGERESFARSYWGLFGGVNVPMSDWIYTALNLLALAALLGLFIFLIQSSLLRFRRLYSTHPPTPTPPHPQTSLSISRAFPHFLLLAQLALLAYGLFQWATVTWSMQGRLVFSGISAIAVLLVVGLRTIVPASIRKWVFGIILAFLSLISLISPFTFISPKYQDPPSLTSAQLAAIPNRLDVDFGAINFPPEMRLLGYDLEKNSIRPGESLRLTLYWQSLAPMDRDWSVFVHLVDEAGIVVAQRDTFPGLGLMPTRKWSDGQSLADTYVIPLASTVYAPAQGKIEIGLYDYNTGDRLLVVSENTPDAGRDALTLSSVTIAANVGDWPNPQSLNFGDQIELVGYDMDRRALKPGESLALTLHWRASRPITTNYSIFAHVRGAGESLWAQHDSWPLDGVAPTASWMAGQVVKDDRTLTLKPETAPGVYDVEVGLYDERGNRLQLVLPDGRLTDNFVYLAKIRVLP